MRAQAALSCATIRPSSASSRVAWSRTRAPIERVPSALSRTAESERVIVSTESCVSPAWRPTTWLASRIAAAVDCCWVTALAVLVIFALRSWSRQMPSPPRAPPPEARMAGQWVVSVRLFGRSGVPAWLTT